MKGITYIFPVFNLSENEELLKKAYKSIGKQDNVIFVGSEEDLGLVKFRGVNKIVNETGDLSYASQVMLALKSVNTDYFAVIEQDDEVIPKWYEFVGGLIEKDTDDTFAFLPLTEVIDNEDGETIGYANEAFWASSFANNIGYLDSGALENYLNFNVSGGVFKTKEFLSLGGLKKSMKLVFWYEFLLRALYKEKKIYVVPRVGYLHKVNRKNTITSIYEETLSEKEAEWWLELAKKEFYFPQDRNKTYEEE